VVFVTSSSTGGIPLTDEQTRASSEAATATAALSLGASILSLMVRKQMLTEHEARQCIRRAGDRSAEQGDAIHQEAGAILAALAQHLRFAN
jgi:hypothetical protein